MKSTLIPIRIDVTAADKALRVVDTLLFDPTVWPLPLTDNLRESVHQNAAYLAHAVLSETEIMGMGRTVRHFTGRLELWSVPLWQAITESVEAQLWNMVQEQGQVVTAAVVDSKKRKLTTASTSTLSEPPTKRLETAERGKEDDNSLIPIRLRLSVHGVRIHDDLQWDVRDEAVNALTVANRLGRDLKLAPEAVQAVAVDVSEQVHGLDLCAGVPPEADEGGPSTLLRGNHTQSFDAAVIPTTAAWALDQRVHITNVAHLVAQHRPKAT